ncbi:hypothetical protein GGI16_009237, partial [Coemansia sp. S142-1]
MALDSLTEWDFHVPLIQQALNARRHRAIGMSPATTMFGRQVNSPHALLGPDAKIMSELTVELLALYRDRIILPTVARNLSEYQARLKADFDCSHVIADFAPGDTVLARVTPTPHKSKPQFIGPFTVREITRNGTMELMKKDGPNAPEPPARRFMPNQLVHLEEVPATRADHFEVDYIIDHRFRKGQVQFR